MQPTIEQTLLRDAVNKALSHMEKRIWDWYAYDRLTTVEIGKRLKVSQQAAHSHIKRIEKRLARWVNQSRSVYHMIKGLEQ